ncbi:MAG: HAMP domain-containing histidine kinase [Bacteroidaceae bacterium]|nr:HAMP domain-containing histidine kinase [Bacteroidaceae bacterium]
MRLIYRVTIRLALFLFPIMLLWGVMFYFSMAHEINDETDDSLEDYAELLIRRTLAGKELPRPGNGSNNTYSIELLPATAVHEQRVTFENKRVYIAEKEETEPARELTMTFPDKEGRIYRLAVSTPTFDREDLIRAIMLHIIILYLLLMLTILIVTTMIFNYSMRPLYALLSWLDRYTPGKGAKGMPTDNSTLEFKKLTLAAYSTIKRAESYMERQKQFIGNASHELQTPLAVLGTRIEWLIDNTALNEEQLAELFKMRQSLQRLVKLNRTLLLLSKIDNRQFPERKDIDITEIIRNEVEVYSDIYSDKGIECTALLPDSFVVSMNESLATTMATNLIKNAFLHTAENDTIEIAIERGVLRISNGGTEPLDSDKLFDRFYTGGKKGSTGLGLALVKSIAGYYDFKVEYSFKKNRHCFAVRMQ